MDRSEYKKKKKYTNFILILKFIVHNPIQLFRTLLRLNLFRDVNLF